MALNTRFLTFIFNSNSFYTSTKSIFYPFIEYHNSISFSSIFLHISQLKKSPFCSDSVQKSKPTRRRLSDFLQKGHRKQRRPLAAAGNLPCPQRRGLFYYREGYFRAACGALACPRSLGTDDPLPGPPVLHCPFHLRGAHAGVC